MIPIARLTDQHACPIPFHVLTPLVTASPTAYVNGIPVARVGDMSGCGAVIVSGFPHILVNGRPMAHVGSLTSHGGSIVTGSHDCVGGEVNFMTSKLVVDFARLGAVNDAGVVNEALMAELLADPQLEQRARAAGALVQSGNAPSLIANFSRSFQVTDSETGKFLANRAYTAVVDGHRISGVTDATGMIQVAAAKADSMIKLHVEFSSPARPLTELSDGLLTAGRFTTLTQAKYVRPGQPQLPVVVTVNDRAATREALIRKVRELGYQFVERSGWKAKPAKVALDKDWDYSMIALHHAGRSYSCGPGAQQMLSTQEMQQGKEKFSDIGYHFGIDCSGNIYEGRDIRFKGSNVLLFNTHVLGIVLLNNLTTPEEGGGAVAIGRKALGALGYETTNQLPEQQIEALSTLLTTLSSFFCDQALWRAQRISFPDEGRQDMPRQYCDGSGQKTKNQYPTTPSTYRMKNIKIIFVLFIFIFIFISIPFIGYYEHHEEISSTPVIFWKKKPSLQIKFYRIFHPNFESGLHELTEIQRSKVIDYCKYRLGIETTLKTEKDFKACRDDLTGE